MNSQNPAAGCRQTPSAVPPALSGWGWAGQQTPPAASQAVPGWSWANQQNTAPQYPAAGYASPQTEMPDCAQAQPGDAESMQYLNGFLRMQVGSRIKAEFLVGTNTYLDKSGKLVAVGANYIVLQEAMTDDLLVCDFFNIKFVTIYR